MESTSAYLIRKRGELRLIEACLARPDRSHRPRSVQDVVEMKFRAGAALKAEQAYADWALTETHWANAAFFRIGQFEVGYNYQRADLTIRGPCAYEALRQAEDQSVAWSSYTSSGMSAIATLLLALGRSCAGAVLSLPPECYSETQQLIEAYGEMFGINPAAACSPPTAATKEGGVGRVVLIDSGMPARFSMPDPAAIAAADLLMFDTTCLATSSGRIGSILQRAEDAGVPTVLVRSHTKLDSLGIEYGRLGSVVLVVPRRTQMERRRFADRLASEMQDAIRLFGAAAVPAHLPPFFGDARWRAAYRQRIARLIRNNRVVSQRLGLLLGDRCTVRCYQHGLFLTLDPRADWPEDLARRMAASLVQELRNANLPVRHAGSFGFDFVAVDAFPKNGDTSILRMALADLPAGDVDAITAETAVWLERVVACCEPPAHSRARGGEEIGRPAHSSWPRLSRLSRPSTTLLRQLNR